MPGVEHCAQRGLTGKVEIVRLVEQQCTFGAVGVIVDSRCGDVVGSLRSRNQTTDDIEQHRLAATANRTGQQQPRRHREAVIDVGVDGPESDGNIFVRLKRPVLLQYSMHDACRCVARIVVWMRLIGVTRIRRRRSCRLHLRVMLRQQFGHIVPSFSTLSQPRVEFFRAARSPSCGDSIINACSSAKRSSSLFFLAMPNSPNT
jgi:hypothetical protein